MSGDKAWGVVSWRLGDTGWIERAKVGQFILAASEDIMREKGTPPRFKASIRINDKIPGTFDTMDLAKRATEDKLCSIIDSTLATVGYAKFLEDSLKNNIDEVVTAAEEVISAPTELNIGRLQTAVWAIREKIK